MTTRTVMVMTGMFAYSAYQQARHGFGVLFVAMAAVFSLLCIGVAAKAVWASSTARDHLVRGSRSS